MLRLLAKKGMIRHKHCRNCQLDFIPPEDRSWEEYCSDVCIRDYQRLHPPTMPTYSNMPSVTMPNTMLPITIPTDGKWHCGMCGVEILNGQAHTCKYPNTTAGSGAGSW